MTKRLNFLTRKNAGIEGLVAVENWIANSFDPKLLDLIKVRVSQINGCAYCLHLHRQDLIKQGAKEERLLLLDAWRDSQLYTQRERAALAWAEALPKWRRATPRTRSTRRRKAPSATTSSSPSRSAWP